MGLLVGLPLKIFHILFVVLRLAWPVLLVLLVLLILKKRRRNAEYRGGAKNSDFDGPGVEVDYHVVEEDEEK